MSKIPETKKMTKQVAEIVAISKFLDYLDNHGVQLACWKKSSGEEYLVNTSEEERDRLLYESLGIDYDRLLQEEKESVDKLNRAIGHIKGLEQELKNF